MENNSGNIADHTTNCPGATSLSNRLTGEMIRVIKTRIHILTILLGLLFLVACADGVQEPTTEPTAMATSAAPLLATVPAKATDTDPTTPASYPSPTEDDNGASAPPGYPEPSVEIPTLDPYPGGFAVIQHPAGVQCEEPLYPDLASATAALEQAGIEVQEAEEIELNVCTACGCPTSAHYRVLINPSELDAALAQGWQRGY